MPRADFIACLGLHLPDNTWKCWHRACAARYCAFPPHASMEGTARMKTYDRLLLGCGLLIPLWLLGGVWLTALAYPGYDHFQQAMSQLGAVGSPVQRWSPWVNNYPLAVLFILFALGLARRWHGSKVALSSAALVLVHGLGSLGTGWFACDPGCAPAQPSSSQLLHNLSGLLMFLSLTWRAPCGRGSGRVWPAARPSRCCPPSA